jgi:limonene-1,2-epoxide hydrolase
MADTAPSEIVRAFLGAWQNGVAALRQSFRDHLADDVDYENIGLTHCSGLAEALSLIENFMPGLDRIDVDMLSIAEDGDKVLTERIDDLRTAEGSLLASLRVMGIFQVRDGKIVAWRDYFDTLPFVASS